MEQRGNRLIIAGLILFPVVFLLVGPGGGAPFVREPIYWFEDTIWWRLPVGGI